MENDLWYDSFLEALHKRFPQRTQLVQELMNLLVIEREAVYRRLRKDVVFPAHEVIKIASTWNIPLYEITGISGQVPFLMQPTNYIEPSDKELDQLQQLVQFLDQLKFSPDSEYVEISNKLSRFLISGFKNLDRFYLFKWMYQYGNNEEKAIPFSRTIISEEKHRLTVEYYQAMKNIANVNYVWDHMLFEYLAYDIRYFYSIQLITDEDKKLIKEDLLALLDYMSEVANKGSFPETKNKVGLYISRINIDTNFSYIYTEKLKLGRIHVFGKHDVYTSDLGMITNFKTWMQLKKRSSVQISEVDERHRIEFFMKQRQLIAHL
ncbi:MAG: hypothetical protein FWF54_06775 [Candidatus Azobacteroides sp.]|nr:hypothetical protein [Candidatus Azobacteroides sp.]